MREKQSGSCYIISENFQNCSVRDTVLIVKKLNIYLLMYVYKISMYNIHFEA